MQTLQLSVRPDAVPGARRFVRETLAGTSAEPLTDDAELIVSELTTNAVLHAAAPLQLRLRVSHRWVRIELADGSRLSPMRAPRPATDMTGRGLALVAALADRHGVHPRPQGKVVWAEIGVPPVDQDQPSRPVPPDGGVAEADRVPPPAERRHTVALGDVPTDLLMTAKAHVDNLIREFVLADAGAAAGSTEALPPHLAGLLGQVTTRFREAREAIKRQALAAAAAGRSRTFLTLSLSASAAAAGEEYLAALEATDAYARAARLLTLETPPQHRAFRRWYIRSLVEQLRRAERGEPPTRPPTLEEHLLGELDEVAAAHRASDRAARLQAVTAALAGATTAAEVARVVVAEGADALGASGGSLLVPAEDDTLAVPGAIGYPDELVAMLAAERRDAALPAATALRTAEAVWIESRQERDLRFPALVGFEPGTVSMCAVPLVAQDRVLGALRFSFGTPRLFDEGERRFVVALAAQTAQALERAELLAAERSARAQTALLAHATELLSASLDPEETAGNFASLLVCELADWALVHRLDDSGRLRPITVTHRDPAVTAALRARLSDPLHDRPAGWLGVGSTNPRTVRYPRLPATLGRQLVQSLGGPIAGCLLPSTSMTVPLLAAGTLVGAVTLARTDGPAYRESDEQLAEQLAVRAAVAMQNALRYQRERDTAITLQQGLLPQRPPRVPGARFAWRYLPAGAGALVGGDWYDVIDLDETHVALVIGDVMGRGVQAAAVMGQLRATARAHAGVRVSPAEILRRMDGAVERLEQGQISTALFCALNTTSRVLTVASAGHLPPLVVPPAGEPYFLQIAPGPPLGAGRPDFAQLTVDLRDGAIVLLFTDGLVEDRTRSVDNGLREVRAAVAGGHGVERVCDAALATLPRRGSGHDDDVAMLAVQLVAEPAPSAGSASGQK